MRKIKAEEDQMSVLAEIGRMVDFCLKNTGIDKEGLATDIWIEIWEGDKELCWTQVRNRCIDAIRKHTRHLIQRLEDTDEAEWISFHEPIPSHPHEDAVEILNIIMKHASGCLSPDEHELVYLRFYGGRTNNEISIMLMGEKDYGEIIKKRIQVVMKKLQQVAKRLVDEGVVDEWT